MSDASDVPAVRYLTAYTPNDPPPPGEVIWSDVNGTHHLRIYGSYVVGREDTDD